MLVNDKTDKVESKKKPKKSKSPSSNPVTKTVSINGVSVSADIELSRDQVALALVQIKDKVLSGA
jgi:hypothetical protein